MEQENSKNPFWLNIIDIGMICLAILNISWLAFDWLFSNEFFSSALNRYIPDFYNFYLPYSNKVMMAKIDLVFVSIFICEFVFQWIYAIVKKTYDDWFIYPFARWYDLLGCIPLASFRWMRLIRVLGLLYRLHKRGIINLKKNFIFRYVNRIREIIFEEISDRVAVKVLDQIENEVQNSGELIKRSIAKVVDPHSENIKRIILSKLGEMSSKILIANKKEVKDLSRSLANEIIEQIFKEWSLLWPLKSGVAKTADIVVNRVMAGAIEALVQRLDNLADDEQIKEITYEAFDIILEQSENEEIMQLISDIVVEVLHVVKQQIAVKQWKEKKNLPTIPNDQL